MVETKSFLVMLYGGNEGFKKSETLDFVFYQRECHARYRYTDFEKEDFWPRLEHK